MIRFGNRFKELRLEKNLTQEELANDFNKKFFYSFGKSAISQYENNKRTPEIDALKDFASYFNVTVDYLLGASHIRNSYDNSSRQPDEFTNPSNAITFITENVLGKRIKLLRLENNLTQKELAEHLNLSPSTIAMYEVGDRKPDSKTLTIIADFFNVSTDFLLNRTSIRTPYKDIYSEYNINKSIFSIRLKELREENNFNQDFIANLLHVDRSTIGKWESGPSEPNYETLLTLSDLFDVSTDYFLGKTNVKNLYLTDSNTPSNTILSILDEPCIQQYIGPRIHNITDNEKLEIAEDLLVALKVIFEIKHGKG